MSDSRSDSTLDVADRLLYTPIQAAHVLGVGRSTLYVLLSNGTIPSVRIGTSRRVRHADLVAYTAALDPVPLSQPGSRMLQARSPRTPPAAIDKPLTRGTGLMATSDPALATADPGRRA